MRSLLADLVLSPMLFVGSAIVYIDLAAREQAEPVSSSHRLEEALMPKYVMLTTLTAKGVQTFQANPDRIREVNRDVEELGAKVLHQWATIGAYDFLNIVEAPDAATDREDLGRARRARERQAPDVRADRDRRPARPPRRVVAPPARPSRAVDAELRAARQRGSGRRGAADRAGAGGGPAARRAGREHPARPVRVLALRADARDGRARARRPRRPDRGRRSASTTSGSATSRASRSRATARSSAGSAASSRSRAASAWTMRRGGTRRHSATSPAAMSAASSSSATRSRCGTR